MGANRLIQDGAALVQGWEDVVAELPERWQGRVSTREQSEPRAERAARSARAGESRRTTSAATRRCCAARRGAGGRSTSVIERSGLGVGPVSAALLDLELEGGSGRSTGKRFVRVGRA